MDSINLKEETPHLKLAREIVRQNTQIIKQSNEILRMNGMMLERLGKPLIMGLGVPKPYNKELENLENETREHFIKMDKDDQD